jgi:hypothetical protein
MASPFAAPLRGAKRTVRRWEGIVAAGAVRRGFWPVIFLVACALARCGKGLRQSGSVFTVSFIAALKRCATQKQKRVLNCTVASPLVVVARSATLRRGEAVSGWGRTELGIGSVRRTLDK